MTTDIKTLFENKEDIRLNNEFKLINSVEYNDPRTDDRMKRLYDIFMGIYKKIDFYSILTTLNSNALNCNHHITSYKINNYGHGNFHIAECYTYMTAMLQSLGVRYELLELACLLHDESLSYGYGRKNHHLDSIHYIFDDYNVNNDRVIKNVSKGLVNDYKLTEINHDLFKDLIRTHRQSPIDNVEGLSAKYNLGSNSDIFYSCISIIDKICMFNPLTVRPRSWDENYDIDIHYKKIHSRFLNKKSESINKRVMELIFGSDDGEFVYNFFHKAVSQDPITKERKDTEEAAIWDKHIIFLTDVKKSGYVRLK